MDNLNDERPQGVISDILLTVNNNAAENGTTFLQEKDVNNESIISLPAEDEQIAEPTNQKSLVSDEVIDLDGEFDYEGYQVVRREFFAHISEPSITFNDYRIYVNAACLNRFPSVDNVQALVNQDSKILAIRPCREEEHDAFAWCISATERRKPKQITCRLFFAKIFTLMCWNPDYRYKLLGKVIHANDEYLVAFDLSATEVYQRLFKDGEKSKTSRTPVFPAGWQDQFGLPFKEHRKSMQVNIFDGYAVYGIRDNIISDAAIKPEDVADTPPDKFIHYDTLGGSDI